MISRDSLGGQNSPRRRSGARSSRALSTIFKKLQKLDRQIAELDSHWMVSLEQRLIAGGYALSKDSNKRYWNNRDKRSKLDHQRKELRAQRKAFQP